MYLKTTKRKNKDGSYTKYYQLAHNVRHPKTKNPVPQVIHSFGRADQKDRKALTRLYQSIARVCDFYSIEGINRQTADKTNGLK